MTRPTISSLSPISIEPQEGIAVVSEDGISGWRYETMHLRIENYGPGGVVLHWSGPPASLCLDHAACVKLARMLNVTEFDLRS